MSSVFEFSMSKLGYVAVFMKIWEKKFWLIFEDIFDQSRQKWRWRWKKFGKMSLIFELPMSNLGYMEIFTKIGEKILTHFSRHFFFSRHFWLTEAKMKTKMEKFGKINSIFEFSIWKVGYLKLFLKICGKKIWPIFRTFLTNRGKNEVEDKKMWENQFEVFIKIWEKRSFLKFLPEKD